VRDVRGNLEGFRCFYHLWAYDLEGRNVSMTRPQGYQRCGLRSEDASLRAVRTDSALGLVFVSLDDDVESLTDYLGGMLPELSKHLGSVELEVFHHHSAVIQANWKFWNDNNTEVYHEYLHVLNRKTMVAQPGYHDRRWRIYPNGHGTAGEVVTNYAVFGLESRAENLFPGLRPNGLIAYALFPDVLLIMRSTVMRIDTMTPLAPDRTLVEWRGLGLKGDTEEVRAMRLRQHNQVWGPAGRNLAEDVAAVESQQRNVMSGASSYSIIAREEDQRPHDDCFFRNYYQEWGRRVGRWPHDLDAPRDAARAPASRERAAHG
jgi:methanesulfonate monooxygenase large subunit